MKSFTGELTTGSTGCQGEDDRNPGRSPSGRAADSLSALLHQSRDVPSQVGGRFAGGYSQQVYGVGSREAAVEEAQVEIGIQHSHGGKRVFYPAQRGTIEVRALELGHHGGPAAGVAGEVEPAASLLGHAGKEGKTQPDPSGGAGGRERVNGRQGEFRAHAPPIIADCDPEPIRWLIFLHRDLNPGGASGHGVLHQIQHAEGEFSHSARPVRK